MRFTGSFITSYFLKNMMYPMRIMFFALALCLCQSLFAQKFAHPAEICAERKRLLALAPPPSADPRSDSLDLQQTIISLDLADMDNQKITGRCQQIFQAKMDNVHEIRLDLEALTVDSVYLNGQKTAFTRPANQIKVNFATPMLTGQTQNIEVFYHGKPTVTSWGGFYFQSGYAYNLGVGIGTEPPVFGRAWFPCFDNFVERSQYDFTVVSPAGKPSFCNGILQNESILPNNNIRRQWQLTQEIPSYLACVAVGPYVTFRRNYPGENGASIPVEIAVAAADSVKLRNSFVHLPQAIEAFEYWYGPYQWPKIGYSVVPFNGGAMEHATNIAYMRSAVDGTTGSETLMAHEFSHHWWGDLATCSSAGDMWLNEGWASYSEHLFLEKVYGPSRFIQAVDENHLSVLQNAHLNEGGYLPESPIPTDYTYGTHVYNKGASIAHNLRGYLGDSLFRLGCRTALAQNSFKDWSSDAFRDKMEAATGVDLDDFFQDWVFSGGYADYSVDSFHTISGVAGWSVDVWVHQRLRGAPHLHQNVPLEFTFMDQNHAKTHKMGMVSGASSAQSFLLPFKPAFVFVNVNHKLNIARADREKVIKIAGNSPFSPAKLDVKINSVSDSTFMRVEHHFTNPDNGSIANPKNYTLTTRFWSVQGEFNPGFDATATFAYDGRGQQDMLDTPLFAQTSPSEDSVLLLYRPGAGQPWAEYMDYVKTTLSANDKFGFLRANHLRAGDYTIGKGVSVVAVKEPQRNLFFATVAPNPAHDKIKIEAEQPFTGWTIYNVEGDTIQEKTIFPANVAEISVSGLVAGQYWVVLKGKNSTAAVSFQKQ